MKKRIIFGKEINLAEYEKNWSKEEIESKFNGEFVDFSFINLAKKNPDDPEFANAGVRCEQNSNNSVLDMQVSYQLRGWDTKDLPPVVRVTDHEFEDGRTRALAAMAENEPFLPVVRIRPKENTKACSFANGLLLNNFPPRRKVVQEDFIVAGAELVRIGELQRDITAIEDWLIKMCKIDEVYPNNAGGAFTKIVNAIYNRTENGGDPIVRKMDREEWLKWLSTSPDMKDESGNRIDPFVQLDHDPDFVLYDAPSSTNEARLLRKLLENGSKGRHTYIVLYSAKENTHEVLKLGFKSFVTTTETQHSSIIRYSQSSIGLDGIDLTKMPNEKMFTFLGVVPILFDGNGHEAAFKAHRILPIDKF
jgi:hypothetical protein